MWMMPWFCVGDVSALCFGVAVTVVMLGDVLVMVCDFSVTNIDGHFQIFSGFRRKKHGCSMCLCYWGRMLG